MYALPDIVFGKQDMRILLVLLLSLAFGAGLIVSGDGLPVRPGLFGAGLMVLAALATRRRWLLLADAAPGSPERALSRMAAQASPEEREAWRKLLESWQSDAHRVELVTDAEVDLLPADRAVWLLGRANRLAPRYFGGGAVAGLEVDDEGVVIEGARVPFAGHATVAVARHPASAGRAIGWITADPAQLAALPGLGRKLPHYGKYSYLGFEGSEPTNVLKGQWAASDSPLRVDLRRAEERQAALPALVLAPRRALAELPAAAPPPRP